MTVKQEKEFIDYKISAEAVSDFTLHNLCDTVEEFEFYSTYGATQKALWERCCSSFDSFDQFLNYCDDIYKNYWQMLQLSKDLEESNKDDNIR